MNSKIMFFVGASKLFSQVVVIMSEFCACSDEKFVKSVIAFDAFGNHLNRISVQFHVNISCLMSFWSLQNEKPIVFLTDIFNYSFPSLGGSYKNCERRPL